jgi:hypothetical protein
MLAKRIAARANVRYVEVDRLLTPDDLYEKQHAKIIVSDSWIIEGLGRKDSIPDRLERVPRELENRWFGCKMLWS